MSQARGGPAANPGCLRVADRGPVDLPTLLDADDVAHLLKLSPKTVYAMARRGDLPAVRLGPTVRFRRQDIARLVLGNDAVPPATVPGSLAPSVASVASVAPVTPPVSAGSAGQSFAPYDWSRGGAAPARHGSRDRRRSA